MCFDRRPLSIPITLISENKCLLGRIALNKRIEDYMLCASTDNCSYLPKQRVSWKVFQFSFYLIFFIFFHFSFLYFSRSVSFFMATCRPEYLLPWVI